MKTIQDYAHLSADIIVWANDKGIFSNSDETTQLCKAVEEIGELSKAVCRNDIEQIVDGIGDVMVCIVNASFFMQKSETRFVELFEQEEKKPVSLSSPSVWDGSSPKTVYSRYSSKEIVLALTYRIGTLNGCTTQDSLRDIISLLKILAYNYGYTLYHCMEVAYNVISKRTGKMENGCFVKD